MAYLFAVSRLFSSLSFFSSKFFNHSNDPQIKLKDFPWVKLEAIIFINQACKQMRSKNKLFQ